MSNWTAWQLLAEAKQPLCGLTSRRLNLNAFVRCGHFTKIRGQQVCIKGKHCAPGEKFVNENWRRECGVSLNTV